MKKGMAIYLAAILLFLLPCSLSVADETECQYEAKADIDFSMRDKPDNQSRKLSKVKAGKYVMVLEYGDEWSKIMYEGEVGYARSKWLYKFRSMDPYLYKVPNYEAPYGLGIMQADVNTKGKSRISSYKSIQLEKGQTVTVHRYDADTDVATVLIWRTYIDLEPGAVAVTPFVPYEDAEAGDIIAGYTTYMPRDYGEPYSDNRRYNLVRATERINYAVLYPGTLFSFNELAGGYGKEGEYMRAKIVGGSGVAAGGGVCQISVLVFSMALMLPFKIESWGMHTAKGLSYCLRECDATVSTSQDLTFCNMLDYAVEFRFVHNESQTAYTVYLIRAE